MVHRAEDCAVEQMIRDMGITYPEYKVIIASQDYLKLLKDKSTREKFAPYIPHIMETMGREAAAGDDSKMKSALQVMGSIAPDNLTLVNQNIMNMTDDELKVETEKLLRALSEDEVNE